LLGLRFENCNEFLFAAGFENCILNFASFYKMGLKNANFKDCKLQEVDFSECNLSGAVFDNCDLTRAAFEHTNLEKADFRTAFNYSIDLELNRTKKAKFSIPGIVGLLDKYEIEIE
jgi:fluoroquinolone resistance protein